MIFIWVKLHTTDFINIKCKLAVQKKSGFVLYIPDYKAHHIISHTHYIYNNHTQQNENREKENDYLLSFPLGMAE